MVPSSTAYRRLGAAGMTAAKLITDEGCLGRTPVDKGLADAQQAGNDVTT